MRPSRGLAGIAAAAAFVALLSLATGGRWNPPRSHDFHAYYTPNAEYLGERLAAGELPLWNPQHGLGGPFLATLQPGALYPPNWLHGVLPTDRVFGLLIALHGALAAVAAGALAGALGANAGGRVVAGLLFALSRHFVDSHWAPPLLFASAYSPAILLAVDRVCRTGSLRWALALGAFVSLQVLAGWPYAVVITALGATLYAAILLASGAVTRAPRALTLLAAAALLGLGWSAPQLLPALELIPLSPRAIGRLSSEQTLLGAAYHDAGLSWRALLAPEGTLAIPGLGAALLLVAGVALSHGEQRRPALALLAVGLLGLAISWPQALPVYGWLAELPLIGDFRFPYRYRLLPMLAACVLAGVGATRLSQALGGRTWQRPAAAVAVVVALAPLLASRVAGGGSSAAFPADLAAAREELAEFGRVSRRDVARVYWSDRSLRNPPTRSVQVLNDLEPMGLARTAEALTFFQTGRASLDYAPPDRPRPFRWGRARLFSGSPYAGLLHVPDDGRRAALLDLLSVDLVTAAEPVLWLRERYGPPTLRREGHLVYENPGALPRAYFVSSAEVEPAARQRALERLVADDFDLREHVLLDRVPEALRAPSAPGPSPPVEVLRYEPELVRLRVETTRHGVVVLTDAYHPGWRAALDGASVPLLRANALVRGVEVPAGSHVIEMRYAPESLRVGLVLAALATGIAAVAYRRSSPRS